MTNHGNLLTSLQPSLLFPSIRKESYNLRIIFYLESKKLIVFTSQKYAADSPKNFSRFLKFLHATLIKNGEGGGRRVQDGEHMYTCGNTNTIM